MGESMLTSPFKQCDFVEYNKSEIIQSNEDITKNNTIDPDIKFCVSTLTELSKSSWSRSVTAKTDVQPYLRGCKWSPDGTCCLCVVNNNGVHVIDLPRDLYEDPITHDRPVDILDTAIHINESGLVYDFCWYPGMHSSYPETCCWITTLQNSPIQMWDAFNGSLRCTYRGFNSVDEMDPALSLTFSVDGSKIIAGYKKNLKNFDVSRPGRDFVEHKINSPASCLAVDSNLLTVGSWNSSISLYSVNELGTYKSIGKMHGHTGGVTHMKFTPDGLKLVSGARKDSRLLIWDIRYYRKPLNVLSRVVDTNQRIYFDISPCGRYLISGSTDGICRVWDTKSEHWSSSSDEMDNHIVTYKFPLHRDCCNSISIHPYKQILATGSGQHHFIDPELALDKELSSEKHEEHNTTQTDKPKLNSVNKYSEIRENCLVFWATNSNGLDEKDVDKQEADSKMDTSSFE